jgi:hypothetical protein
MTAAVSSDRCDRLGIDQVEPCADKRHTGSSRPRIAGREVLLFALSSMR